MVSHIPHQNILGTQPGNQINLIGVLWWPNIQQMKDQNVISCLLNLTHWWFYNLSSCSVFNFTFLTLIAKKNQLVQRSIYGSRGCYQLQFKPPKLVGPLFKTLWLLSNTFLWYNQQTTLIQIYFWVVCPLIVFKQSMKPEME